MPCVNLDCDGESFCDGNGMCIPKAKLGEPCMNTLCLGTLQCTGIGAASVCTAPPSPACM
jgi:hypothetical protein